MASLAPLRADGLELAIFPSQDYGAQELKSDAEVEAFARSRGFEGVVFRTGPVMSRPVFQHCIAASGAGPIAWNFKGLFLVSRSGAVRAPGEDLEADVRALLAEAAPDAPAAVSEDA